MDSRILPMYHRDSHCLPLASAPSLLETHSNSDGSCSYIYLYHNSLHFSSQRLTPLIRPAHLRLASQLPLPPRIFFVLLFFVAHRKLCGVWEAVAKLAWSLKKAGWSEAVAVFPTAASITSKDLNNIVLFTSCNIFTCSLRAFFAFELFIRLAPPRIRHRCQSIVFAASRHFDYSCVSRSVHEKERLVATFFIITLDCSVHINVESTSG